MNKKIFFTSILSLVLCLGLIAGGTFALFTSESETNIAINSGKVELVATLENLQTFSIEPNAANDGYDSVPQSNDTFANGGTAVIKDGLLTLDRMTPGDKATFDIVLENKSDVAIQYQTIIRSLNDTGLFAGLTVMIEDEVFNGITATSDWIALAAKEQPADRVISVSVELPESAGNIYQATSTELLVTVNAVQGNATVNNPNPDENAIELYTADDLVAFANFVNKDKNNSLNGKTVKLMNNVDMAGKVYTPAGTASAKFDGTFDGQNYTISNLNVSNSAYAGLFGAAWTSSVIENVNLKDVILNTNHFAGAVVAHTYGTVKNCTVDGASIVCLPELVNGAYDNGDKVGGIAGFSACGEITGNIVKNSTITAYRDLGGILGCNQADDTYTVVSNNVIENVTLNVDASHNYNSYTSIDSHNAKSIVGRNAVNGDSNEGTATISYVVSINNLAELKAFRDSVNGGNAYAGYTVMLTSDIDLGNEEWTSIGLTGDTAFAGAFDGNGHTISNLYMSKSSRDDGYYAGLFANSKMTEIKNLTIHNANVSGKNQSAVLIGKQRTSINISNIKFTGDIYLTVTNVEGGLVVANGPVTSISDVTVNVSDKSYVKCLTTSTDTWEYLGGLWGHVWPTTAKNIYSNIDVYGYASSIGGIGGACAINSENVVCDGDVIVTIDDIENFRGYDCSMRNGLIYGFGVGSNNVATHKDCSATGKLIVNGKVITSLETTDDHNTADPLWNNGYQKNDVRFGVPYYAAGVITIED